MADENETNKVLVFEIAIPDMMVEEIEKAAPDDVPLQFVLGHRSNQVTIVWQNDPHDADDWELGAYQGYVVRAHLADIDWVTMVSDKAMKPPEDDE